MFLPRSFFKFTAALLLGSIVSLPLAAQTVNNGDAPLPAIVNVPLISGVLNSAIAGNVYINGNRAQNGMTILSGTNLETLDSKATIVFADLGVIRVCPQTKVNIVFSNGQIEAKLTGGSLRLEPTTGVSGKIIMPDNRVLTSDASTMIAADNYQEQCRCEPGSGVGAYVVERGTPFFGVPLPAVFGVFGGVVALAAIGSSLDNDNSTNSISNVVP